MKSTTRPAAKRGRETPSGITGKVYCHIVIIDSAMRSPQTAQIHDTGLHALRRWRTRIVTAAACWLMLFAGGVLLSGCAQGGNPAVSQGANIAGIARLSLTPNSLALLPGQIKLLTVTAYNAMDKTIAVPKTQLYWQSADWRVAAVDATGRVSGTSPGTTTITATAADGQVRASVAVTVVNLRIGQYEGDRNAALSMTFDDGLPVQLAVTVPILNSYNLKGTFYIIANQPKDSWNGNSVSHTTWTQWQSVQAQGHEIGNHSMTHAYLNTITDPAVLDTEINGAADLIAQKLGHRPLTFAFPSSAWDAQAIALVLQHHIAWRDNPTGCFSPVLPLSTATGWIDTALRNQSTGKKNWVVTIAHGIDGLGSAPCTSQFLQQFCDYARSKSSALWIDTYAHVASYIAERNAATFSLTGMTDSSLSFTVNTSLDSRYTQPLTVVYTPANATAIASASAMDNTTGAPLPVTIKGSTIYIDVAPGPDTVTVTTQTKKCFTRRFPATTFR